MGVAELQGYLLDEGFDALSLHGDLEQIDRDEHLLLFANGSAQILVATDLAVGGQLPASIVLARLEDDLVRRVAHPRSLT